MALDPAIGKTGATGVALLAPSGELKAATIIRNPSGKTDLAAQFEIAKAVVVWANAAVPAHSHGGEGVYAVKTLIAEAQVVRRGRNKNPNYLLGLAGVVGNVSGMLPASVKRVHPKPEEWKSNLPKDAFAKRILSRCTPAELAVLNTISPASLRLNAIEAAGLGFWFTGQLEPRRVYPR